MENRASRLSRKLLERKKFPLSKEIRKANKGIIQKIKEKSFRISRMGLKQKIRHKRTMSDISKKLNAHVDTVNMVHIDNGGNIHLVPAYKYLNSLSYEADKRFIRTLSDNDKISVIFPDGSSEEGYLCDELGVKNYKIIPAMEEKGKHFADEYVTAQNELQDRILLDIERKSSVNENRARKMMLISGMGMGIMGSFLIGVLVLIIL